MTGVKAFSKDAARVRAAMVPFVAAASFLGLPETTARRNVKDADGRSVLAYGRHEVEVVKATPRGWKVPVSDLARVSGLSVNEVIDALSGRSEAGAA